MKPKYPVAVVAVLLNGRWKMWAALFIYIEMQSKTRKENSKRFQRIYRIKFVFNNNNNNNKIERSDKIQHIDEASKRTVLLRFMIMAVKWFGINEGKKTEIVFEIPLTHINNKRFKRPEEKSDNFTYSDFLLYRLELLFVAIEIIFVFMAFLSFLGKNVKNKTKITVEKKI